MNFEYSDDQRALADTVQRFIARDYGFDRRRAILASPPGWSTAAWAQLAELGVLGINVPEEHGGLGWGPLETGLVMAALGRGLVVEPYLAAAVVAPVAIRRAAGADFQAQWLPRIAGGESVVVLAHYENGSRWNDEVLSTRASRSGEGWLLSGHKGMAAHAGCADLLLISARTDDGEAALFAVAPGTPGVALRDYPTFDGQRAAEVMLDNVALPFTARVGSGDATARAIADALDANLAALCAEAVGILEATVDATAEYLRTRQQFGQPLARFQALQHRMADMLLHLEQARSMSLLASMRCAGEDLAARRRILSAAKVAIGQACRFVGQQAVQLHGGMGMTDELIVSHWFKRLTAIELSLGDTDTHLQRFIRLSRHAA